MVERQQLQKMLDTIQEDLLKMGGLAEAIIHKAVESLKNYDLDMAEEVLAMDKIIDALELTIEETCILAIATQQPLANDLRKISAAFKIITDLERIGDHACGIAKVTKKLNKEPLIKPLIDLPRMAYLAQKMLKKTLDAYVSADEELAKSVGDADNEVDSLHDQIFNELVLLMLQEPRNINQAAKLLFVSRSLERVADHAANIAERVVYMISGKRLNLN